jgi:hypothetical protein
MKNFDIYGVRELNAREVKETEGGLFGLDDLAALAIGLTLVAATEIIGDWEHFKDGLAGR